MLAVLSRTPALYTVLLPNLSWGRRGGKKKINGGIRFRLTVGVSEAGLVQHLLSRWWRKSEDWVHSWNSKRMLPSYRVCSSSFPVTFSETHEYRRTNAHNVVVAWAEFQGHPGPEYVVKETTRVCLSSVQTDIYDKNIQRRETARKSGRKKWQYVINLD